MAPALTGLLGVGATWPVQAFGVSSGVEEDTFVRLSFDAGESMFELAAGNRTRALPVNDSFDEGDASDEETAPIPLPPSVLMLGTAAAAMLGIHRKRVDLL